MLVMTEALIVGLAAGCLGGCILAWLLPRYGLGVVGSPLAGIAGGGALSQIFFTLFPMLQNASNSDTTLSFAGALAHIVVGGIGGALLTLLIGKLKTQFA